MASSDEGSEDDSLTWATIYEGWFNPATRKRQKRGTYVHVRNRIVKKLLLPKAAWNDHPLDTQENMFYRVAAAMGWPCSESFKTAGQEDHTYEALRQTP